jgi:hypothetical protein
MGSLNYEQLQNVYEWCQMADERDGTKACIQDALQSLFWGGENKPDASIGFCSILSDDKYYQSACYKDLISSISFYVKDTGEKDTLCDRLPSPYSDECKG